MSQNQLSDGAKRFTTNTFTGVITHHNFSTKSYKLRLWIRCHTDTRFLTMTNHAFETGLHLLLGSDDHFKAIFIESSIEQHDSTNVTRTNC